MNLSALLTTLAFVTAAEAKLGGTPSFAEQVSFLEAPCEGCAPKYCYPQYADPDNKCYKDGFPKCCSKSKGNCPNHNKPGCECLPGTCGGSGGDKKTLGVRCTRGDGTCKGSTFCKTTEGTCAGGGRCEDMTTSCDRSMKQVCGCNGATYDNECAAFGVGVSVDYDRPCGSSPVADDCVEMGDTAAELVVMYNWCSPNTATSNSFPNYASQCKKVATNVCKGQIPSVARRWCSDEAMTTTNLLDLQRKCEDQVNRMLHGRKLAFKAL